MKSYLALAILLIVFVACKKKQYSQGTPEITFESVSTKHVLLNNGVDSEYIGMTIRYKLPTANIGEGLSASSIIFVDNRDTFRQEQRRDFPEESIEYEVPDHREFIKGTVTLLVEKIPVFNTRTNRPNGDTVTFDMYMVDPTGTKSNVITTDTIFITP
ncbi:MAG: hypothetical protein H6551_03705 [Chitinophagales bacterium]|nr:hypothetical protein [Chitinophagaceae bacterium]MCB9064228.1 hypothetical protein [Chitinophagales bacterium]